MRESLASQPHINGLVQERRNFSALAMELCLSCTSPSIYSRSNRDFPVRISMNINSSCIRIFSFDDYHHNDNNDYDDNNADNYNMMMITLIIMIGLLIIIIMINIDIAIVNYQQLQVILYRIFPCISLLVHTVNIVLMSVLINNHILVESVVWYFLSVPKHQRYKRWSSWMEK